jgi:hypothetical protein
VKNLISIDNLSGLISELNQLIDNGSNLSIKQAKKLCESGKLIEELEKKFPYEKTGFDLSLLSGDLQNTNRYHINKGFQEKASLDKKEYNEKQGLPLLVEYAKQLIEEKGEIEE